MKSWKLHISPAREFSYHASRVGGDAAYLAMMTS